MVILVVDFPPSIWLDRSSWFGWKGGSILPTEALEGPKEQASWKASKERMEEIRWPVSNEFRRRILQSWRKSASLHICTLHAAHLDLNCNPQVTPKLTVHSFVLFKVKCIESYPWSSILFAAYPPRDVIRSFRDFAICAGFSPSVCISNQLRLTIQWYTAIVCYNISIYLGT